MPSKYFSANDMISPGQFMMFPKELLTERFSDISLDAKVLYTLLLDRVSLSIKNGLVDPDGRVYVVCKQIEIQNLLGYAKQKVQKMFSELEKAMLIDRKKQGSNLPDLIFVKKLSTETVEKPVNNMLISEPTDENQPSPGMKNIPRGGMKISPLNNTNINQTEYSETKSIYPVSEESKDKGLMDSSSARSVVCDQIDYNAIAPNIEDPQGKLALNNIVSLMTEVYSQDYGKIKVNGELHKYTDLRVRFSMIDQFHVEYVLECIEKRKNSSEPIVNLKAYLATALYNAPLTMESYYQSQVKYMQTQVAVKSKYSELDALAW